MKKFIALFLTMTLIFTMLGTTTVFAATQDTFSINGTNDESETMIGGKTIPVDIRITGINPTFTFSISGNNSLYVDVYLQKPGGSIPTIILSNIPCNGTTYTIPVSHTITGTYIFTVYVNHGSSWGESKNIEIYAVW